MAPLRDDAIPVIVFLVHSHLSFFLFGGIRRNSAKGDTLERKLVFSSHL